MKRDHIISLTHNDTNKMRAIDNRALYFDQREVLWWSDFIEKQYISLHTKLALTTV